MGEGVTAVPWIGDFISGIRAVFLFSVVFLAIALIPSFLRGSYQDSKTKSSKDTNDVCIDESPVLTVCEAENIENTSEDNVPSE